MRIKTFEQWRAEKKKRSELWRLIAAALLILSILICMAGCRKKDGYLDTGPVMIDDSMAPAGWQLPRDPQTYDQSFWEAD